MAQPTINQSTCKLCGGTILYNAEVYKEMATLTGGSGWKRTPNLHRECATLKKFKEVREMYDGFDAIPLKTPIESKR